MLSECKYKISVLSPPNTTATLTEHFSLLFPSNSVSLMVKWVRISDNISLPLHYLIPFHRFNFFWLGISHCVPSLPIFIFYTRASIKFFSHF